MPAKPAPAPSDAIVLFDGKDLSKWTNQNWLVNPKEGYMEVRRGENRTKDTFGDMHLHIEFRTPDKVVGNSQGRGNSGVFLMGIYEIQVLDSWENPTYPDGQCGAIYGQRPPMVNASRKPGEWQSYDIFFRAPQFKDGKVEKPAFVTVIHNGILIHNNVEILGTTFHQQAPRYVPHASKGPIALQDHGNPMRFRNIWVRPLNLGEDAA
jgi:hypothetical protein